VNPRAYDSPLRQEKARSTERRVLAAMRDLLLAQGWAGTTMTAVAGRAHVSPTLLYKTFGTKAALAKRLYDVTLAGDEQPVPMSARPEIAAILAEPDPARKIALYVHLGRTINERLAPLTAALRAGAAAGDSELAEFVETTDRERLIGATGLVQHLAQGRHLRAGLSVERAADALWILGSPELIHCLTTDRGWSFDDLEEWLTRQITAALLD
jgi:AcrR family transcriptional regulator